MRKSPTHSTRGTTVWVTACTLVIGSAVLGAREGSHGSGPSSHVMSQAEQPLRQYRAFRRMHASSAKYEAWLEAWTELKDGRFSYEIVSERGSESVRGKVLRTVLAREQELINSGDADRGDLTSENYEFGEAAQDVDGSSIVPIKPRRNDVLLVDGRAVLNDRGELLRVEGKLSKNPSFWTSLVNIVRNYARVGGVRVPVETQTTAKVKFVGTAQLQVLYDYQSVNDRPVSFSAMRSEVRVHTAGQ
jgi:hypothetical protein